MLAVEKRKIEREAKKKLSKSCLKVIIYAIKKKLGLFKYL